MFPHTSISRPRQRLLYQLQLSLILGILVSLSSTYAAILDSVPSQCTSACGPVATSIEQDCQYLTCICDDQHGKNFQSCLTCLYRLSPNNDTYGAAQGTLQTFQTNCNNKLTVALNITSISPSGTSSTSSSTSSASSTSGTPSNSTTSRSPTPTSSASSNSTIIPSSSSTPTTSATSSSPSSSSSSISTLPTQGTSQQICRLRSANAPKRIAVSSTSQTADETLKPINVHAVLAFLAVLVFIPIAMLVVR